MKKTSKKVVTLHSCVYPRCERVPALKAAMSVFDTKGGLLIMKISGISVCKRHYRDIVSVVHWI